MIDWARIENEKTFQRLVNHLFALECDSPAFIPSSPYIGADGGWDGRFDGYYPPEGKSGVWSIQAKWTKKSFSEAESALTPAIREEVGKARRNGVDHLRIATNAELTVGQITSLEGLNRGEVATLRVWHREELTRRIELKPYVRHLFFGDPQYPAFVPWNKYFDLAEKDLLPEADVEIARLEALLRRAYESIGSPDSSILVIYGPPGYGRSHLLRAVARTAHHVDAERQTWLLRSGHRPVSDALQDELVAGSKLLLLFDDADRFLDDVRTLVSFCKHQGQLVKVVLVSSIAGVQAIRDVLLELRCDGLSDELALERWSTADLVEVLRASSGQEAVEDEEAIAGTLGNPFLVVWAGRLMRSDESIAVSELKSTFVNQLVYDARLCLSGALEGKEVRDFMLSLASIVPFSSSDDRVRAAMAARFELAQQPLERALDRLERAGVLSRVGGLLRFDPQVKGELFLAFELEAAADAAEVEHLGRAWMPMCCESFLTNLCAAARHVRLPHVTTAVSRVVREWTLDAQHTQPREKAARIGTLVQASRLIPDDCVDLLHAYLDEASRMPNGHRATGVSVPSADEYGAALSELVSIPSIRSDVVSAIEKVAALPGKGVYHNYSPEFLLRRCVSPIYNSPALVDQTLTTLADWVDRPNRARIRLLTAALSEVLAGAHEYSRSYGDRVELGAKVLKQSPRIVQTRDRAMEILERMLIAASKEVRLAGIDVAAHLGEALMARVSAVELSLSGRIAEERERLVPIIGGLVDAADDFESLNAIENLFLDWWAMERAGTQAVTEHLVEFPRTPEYLVYRHYVSPEHAVMDFRSLAAQAPVEGRWPWYVDNVRMRPSHWRPAEFAGLVGVLAAGCRSETDVVSLLNGVESLISAHSVWAQPPIVRCWVEEKPDIFARIRADGTLWPRVPDRFKREIDIALGSTDSAALAAQADELISGAPDISLSSVDAFLISILQSDVDRAEAYRWTSDLIARATQDQCCLVIFRLPSIFPGLENAGHLAELVTVALSRHYDLFARCNASTWVAVRRILEHRNSLDQDCLDKLRAAVLEALKEAPRLDFHARELLEFALCGVESAIQFVEYRLEKAAHLSQHSGLDAPFEAFPYIENVEAVPLQISSPHDFAVIMDLLLTWFRRPGVWVGLGVEALLQTVAGLRNQDTGRLYLEDFVGACLESGETGKACEAARFLPLEGRTPELLLAVAESAIQMGEAPRAEALLRHHMRPPRRVVYSSAEPSGPDGLLANRRDLFHSMYRGATGGQLRSIIKRCMDQLDAELETLPDH